MRWSRWIVENDITANIALHQSLPRYATIKPCRQRNGGYRTDVVRQYTVRGPKTAADV